MKVKVARKNFFHKAKKIAETVLKDARAVFNAYTLKEDPVRFAEEILNFHPFDYQEQLLSDASKRICASMARQTGKSTTIACKAIHFAATKRNKTILIVSATLRQSMLMFDKIISYIYSSKLMHAIRYRSRTKIIFTNGSSIIALPCGNDGSTLRGFTADVVILDEAAFIPEEVIAAVIMPMLATTDGYCWMLSTPWSRDHIFYKAFNDADWSRYHLPSSANPLIDEKFLDEQREIIGEERFAMEYLAQFIDDSNSYFPFALIRQCVDDYTFDIEGELFAGYDPGGKQSLAAFVIIRRIDDKLYLVYKKAERSKSYTEFNVEIAEMYGRHNFRLFVDQTGLGNPIAEHLKELGIDVKGIALTERRKEELLSNMKMLMEERKVALPYDLEVHNALNAIEYQRTRTGGYRFYKRNGTYDDLGYALAMACFAAKEYGSSGVVIVIDNDD